MRDGPRIARLLEGSYFTSAARRRITSNLKQEVRENVYTFMYMYPEPCTFRLKELLKVISTAAQEAKESSTTV